MFDILSKKTINCNGKLIDLSTPIVMGILNITPDSFYDGGRNRTEELILEKVKKHISEGASLIDIGAYSSRPGAANVSETEEWQRLEPVLKLIRRHFSKIVISVDTFRSVVARKAVEEFQVSMINDISAGNLDAKMFETVAKLGVPYIMMHIQGTPQNMQQKPEYKNIIKEVSMYFAEKIERLKLLGVNDVIIDPGFGFGKTIEHNYELLQNLSDFKIFNLPILVGLSRKSMLYKFLETTPDEALNATTVVNTIALLKGANILRVHDVKEAMEAIKIVGKTIKNSE